MIQFREMKLAQVKVFYPCCSISKEDRQPYGWLIRRGPRDPMFSVYRNEEMVTRFHLQRRSVNKIQLRLALQYDHPLGLFLIVQKISGRDMAGGDNSLNADMLILSEYCDQFFRTLGCMIGEQIQHDSHPTT